MAASKTTKKATAKKRSSAGKKGAAKRKTSPAQASAKGADRADKSVEDFREALERSVTLSRERIQEVVDDAAKRGKMTRKDANELVNKLVTRGRKETNDLLKDLEKALKDTRKEVESRAKKARKGVERRAGKARKEAGKQVTKARKSAVEAADEPLRKADQVRADRGIPGPPITAYDELSAAQVKKRIKDLTKADARKVRTQEKEGKARKGVLDEIEKRLAE